MLVILVIPSSLYFEIPADNSEIPESNVEIPAYKVFKDSIDASFTWSATLLASVGAKVSVVFKALYCATFTATDLETFSATYDETLDASAALLTCKASCIGLIFVNNVTHPWSV